MTSPDACPTCQGAGRVPTASNTVGHDPGPPHTWPLCSCVTAEHQWPAQGEHHDHERLWTQEPGYRLAIAQRDRYREALERLVLQIEGEGVATRHHAVARPGGS
jgi:hypothetical protein